MKDIPLDIQMRYIKHPFFCPFCESQNIVAVTNAETEHDFATQVIGCDDCGNNWVDVYQLSGIEPYEEF